MHYQVAPFAEAKTIRFDCFYDFLDYAEPSEMELLAEISDKWYGHPVTGSDESRKHNVLRFVCREVISEWDEREPTDTLRDRQAAKWLADQKAGPKPVFDGPKRRSKRAARSVPSAG